MNKGVLGYDFTVVNSRNNGNFDVIHAAAPTKGPLGSTPPAKPVTAPATKPAAAKPEPTDAQRLSRQLGTPGFSNRPNGR